VGAGGCSGRGRSAEEVVLPAGKRRTGMAETQVSGGEFRATKHLEAEGGGLKCGENRGSRPPKTWRGKG